MMRKFILLAAGFMATAVILLATGAAAELKKELPQEAAEQVILRLLHQPIREAVNDHYDGLRQYWKQEVLSVEKVSQSPHYQVAIQVETFCGPHNPPYGLETLAFRVDPMGTVQLIGFDHQDEPD